MKKIILSCVLSLLLVSCRKCINCTCYKAGKAYSEKECNSSLGSTDLTSWKRKIIDKGKYDDCKCYTTSVGF